MPFTTGKYTLDVVHIQMCILAETRIRKKEIPNEKQN